MKTLLLFFALLASANVFAHTCHISLYDPYNRPYLNFYSQNDMNCQEAARRCYDTINYNRLPRQYQCYTISMTADYVQPTQPTQPSYRPTQPTQPVQRPDYIAPDDREFLRDIEMGETVYYKNTTWMVVYGDGDKLFELMPVGGKKDEIIRNIPRAEIAITRGCLRKVCTKTSVIYSRAQKPMAVEAITYAGLYVLKDVESKAVYSDVPFLDLQKQ